MYELASSSSNQSTRQSREAGSHRGEDAEWLPTPLSEQPDEEVLSSLGKIMNPVSPGTFSTQPPDTTEMYAEHLSLSHTGPADTVLREKSPFRRKIRASELEANKQHQSPFALEFGGSRKFVPVIPRPGTFKRQDSERRERLTPLEAISSERKSTAKSGTVGRRTMSPKECALDYEANDPLKSAIPIIDDTTFAAYSGTAGRRAMFPMECAFFDEANDPTKSELFINNDTTVDIDTPVREPLDEQIQNELETKWISNLSMQFRDRTPREKFFVTYAETPTKSRSVTISCDYRNAPPDSLEEELKGLQSQRDKSAAIYEAIRDSLPDVKFFDTVTNLKLETMEGGLHVYVTEDVNEVDHFSQIAFDVIPWERHDVIPWEERQRWAKQIVHGLSNIHEAGFVQGDFTLSNIVIDENDEAQIIDSNRRGCPVGWESPEMVPLVESGQRLSMYNGVKSAIPAHASSSSSLSVAQAAMTFDPGSADSSRLDIRGLQNSKKKRTMLELKRFFDEPIQKAGLVKLKQGLVGFANGANIAAMADTGSRENIISAAYAKDLGLKVEGSPSSFKIGNAQKIQSLGTVSLRWAFAENSKKSFSILCHVLPRCTYSLILGNGFLRATETITKFRHRLTKCLFSVIKNVSHFGFLGETYQRLEGTIADLHQVFAIPDTGADRNVMSLQYAIDNGLEIKTEPENRGYLQFADGSFDETVGQVDTYWTFASGQRIPVTFEILRYCCSEVIIGEEIFTEHEVFEKHAGSILYDVVFDDDSYELAPFDFVNSWQRGYEGLVQKVTSRKGLSHPKAPTTNAEAEEQHRRNVWNHKYDFGARASTVEKELEKARRERYKANCYPGNLPSSSHPNGDSSHALGEKDLPIPQRRMPKVPSIPTSQSRR